MDNKREPRKPEEEIRELIEQYGSLEEAGEQAAQTAAAPEEDAAETGGGDSVLFTGGRIPLGDARGGGCARPRAA